MGRSDSSFMGLSGSRSTSTGDHAFHMLHGRLASPCSTSYGARGRPFDPTQREALHPSLSATHHTTAQPRTGSKIEGTLTTTSAIAPTCSRSSSLAYCSGPTTISAHAAGQGRRRAYRREEPWGGFGKTLCCSFMLVWKGRGRGGRREEESWVLYGRGQGGQGGLNL